MRHTFLLNILTLCVITTILCGSSTHSASIKKKHKLTHPRIKKTNSCTQPEGKKSSVAYYTSMSPHAKLIYEQISGELAVELAYGPAVTKTERMLAQYYLTKAALRNHEKPESQKDIRPFVINNHINMEEALFPDLRTYKNYNEFFYRKLKPESRIIDNRISVVSSPTDCKLRILENISADKKFFVKQELFNLAEFLDIPNNSSPEELELLEKYENGTLLNFRLAPTDYHRFHAPFDCTIAEITPIFFDTDERVLANPEVTEPGGDRYHTVSPIAFRSGYWPISINKRVRIKLIPIDEEFGDEVIMMVVGAAVIASINLTFLSNKEKNLDNNKEILWDKNRVFVKGEELGYFSYGGSTIDLLFQQNTIKFPDLLVKRSTNNAAFGKKTTKKEDPVISFETAVKVGQGVATAINEDQTECDLLQTDAYLNELNPHLTTHDTLYQHEKSWFIYQDMYFKTDTNLVKAR